MCKILLISMDYDESQIKFTLTNKKIQDSVIQNPDWELVSESSNISNCKVTNNFHPSCLIITINLKRSYFQQCFLVSFNINIKVSSINYILIENHFFRAVANHFIKCIFQTKRLNYISLQFTLIALI